MSRNIFMARPDWKMAAYDLVKNIARIYGSHGIASLNKFYDDITAPFSDDILAEHLHAYFNL